MYKRLFNIPIDSQNSYFIFGPRGTGKTTWIKTHLPECCYIDLLDQEIYLDLHATPYRLKEYYTKDRNQWIVIDEVQKIPNLLNEVHKSIESEQRRFILTGSSARSLRKKGVNLLAGRALEQTIHPLTAIEQGERFDLSAALKYGQLPMVKSHQNPREYLSSYVNTYLREEVLQEGLTRNIQAFHRFLEAASLSHGQQINMSAIAREIGMDNKVVDGYFNILEDLLIAKRIPVFSKRAKRRLSQHPKFYYFDAGIYNILRPRGPLDHEREINGAGLEGLFLQEMIAINAYYKKEYAFYFWRTANHLEIDFVLYGPNGLYAFEIKSRTYIDKSDLKGLKAFQQDYPMANCFIIYLGNYEKNIDGIRALPITQALMQLDTLI